MQQKQHLNQHDEQGWQGWLRAQPLVQRLQRRFVQNRDTRIGSGVGKGLLFNPADGNPEYALGTNELPVQQALAAYLRPGGVFYDIGANVGFFSVIGARLVGEKGSVIAFEPVPENAAAVRHNCELNGFSQVQVWEAAVSDSSGAGELQLAHFSGGASLAIVAPPPDMKGTLRVKLVTIDELVAHKQIAPPSLVKIDVEGAEIHVLRGMQSTIESYRPIIFLELDDGERNDFLRKKSECMVFLKQMGYAITLLPASYPDSGWIVENFVALPA